MIVGPSILLARGQPLMEAVVVMTSCGTGLSVARARQPAGAGLRASANAGTIRMLRTGVRHFGCTVGTFGTIPSHRELDPGLAVDRGQRNPEDRHDAPGRTIAGQPEPVHGLLKPACPGVTGVGGQVG